jgi:hypothetical protein
MAFDTSGSVAGERLGHLIDAGRGLLATLRSDDRWTGRSRWSGRSDHDAWNAHPGELILSNGLFRRPEWAIDPARKAIPFAASAAIEVRELRLTTSCDPLDPAFGAEQPSLSC